MEKVLQRRLKGQIIMHEEGRGFDDDCACARPQGTENRHVVGNHQTIWITSLAV